MHPEKTPRHSGTTAQVYAHSFADRQPKDWELLAEHLRRVAALAAQFAAVFGWGEMARVAALLHDIGKCSEAFQAYLRVPRVPGGPRTYGPDHSTAGAREARAAYPKQLGLALAAVIAAHHAGLADLTGLDERLGKELEAYDGWQTFTGPLPEASKLIGTRIDARPCDRGFDGFFFIRMLFSCLVDADSLATEQVVAEAEGTPIERGGHLPLSILAERLRRFMADKRSSDATILNTLRNQVLDHCLARAALPPGLFTLTVPTGGGKTLASLSFALEHALMHGLRRVIYVIPFTSIIEQTADVFRDALGTDKDVLEHHASFDWDRAEAEQRDDSEGADALAKLRKAAENWDVPVVVTTAVQFFESLFAAHKSRSRKLHNLARSVIVLDEAQTLPLPLLRPCMAALDQLARNYNASVVLCTATQPALRAVDGFKNGFDLDDTRELAPDPPSLYRALRRVSVEHLPGKTDDATITARFAAQAQMLCIVNTRGHAHRLFDGIRDLPGAVHLTTLMCPRHRRKVLQKVKRDLKAGRPVRLVATSLIEAGVDVSFPEVWRAATGLDSVAQAAGRCNREGGPVLGRVVVFDPAEVKRLPALEQSWQAAEGILRQGGDPLSLEAVHAYFSALYWQKGDEATDTAKVGERPGIMPAVSEQARNWTFPFESIAAAFRLIDEVMEPVIVPWQDGPEDDAAEQLLGRVASMDRLLAADRRQLQQYTVSIPRNDRLTWLAAGVLRPVRRDMGEALLRFTDLAHYDQATGVNLQAPEHRDAEYNIF